MKKIAVILFNLGGPDSLTAVKPFLFNLFYDPAILGVPNPMRFFLAKLLSSKRDHTAQEIYKHLGGKSPIMQETKAQQEALEAALSEKSNDQYKTFICMRYWHPMTQQVVAQVKAYQPDQIILLPLYPQFSTTTTGSSIKEWNQEAQKQGLNVPTRAVGCYPLEESFIEAHAKTIRNYYERAAQKGMPRVLFSAHGLPEKIIKKGDPYQWQVEQTIAAVVKKLSIPDLDYVGCYQSRVGPLKWIGPSTEEEIKRAGSEKRPIVLVPIAFVSEHSETLVELDIEYKELAHEHGVVDYERVPALSTNPYFIEALAGLCLEHNKGEGTTSHANTRLCPPEFTACPCRKLMRESQMQTQKAA